MNCYKNQKATSTLVLKCYEIQVFIFYFFQSCFLATEVLLHLPPVHVHDTSWHKTTLLWAMLYLVLLGILLKVTHDCAFGTAQDKMKERKTTKKKNIQCMQREHSAAPSLLEFSSSPRSSPSPAGAVAKSHGTAIMRLCRFCVRHCLWKYIILTAVI